MKRWGLWLALAATLVFLPSLVGSFVFDDQHLIVKNPYLRDWSYAPRALTTHLWDVPGVAQAPELLHYYRPLATLSYLLDWQLGSGRAAFFHLTNVVLHAIGVVLAFLIGRRWLKDDAPGAVAALIFALHPTKTESVAWVSGRPDLLAGVFLLAWVELIHLASDVRRRFWALALASLALCGALLSKEIAVAAPLLLIIEALATKPGQRRFIWQSCGLSVGLIAFYLAARAVWMPIGGERLSWTPLHALVTVLHYAERIALPWPQTFYYRALRGDGGLPSYSTLECTLGAAIIGLYCLALGLLVRRRPLGATCLLTAVAFLGPLLNLTKTGAPFTTSDRFLYLPIWLLALGILDAAPARWNLVGRQPWARLLLIGLLVGYGSVDALRCLDFQSPLALWTAEVAVNPKSPVARLNRAIIRADEGDPTGALADLEVALSPAARRYVTLAQPENQVTAYLLLLSIQADQLPDGAARELDTVALELLRILAGEPAGHRRQIGSIETGYELDEKAAGWVAGRGIAKVAMAAVSVLSRVERHQTTPQVLDLVSNADLARASKPLDIVLAEAREGRFEQARERLAFLQQSPLTAVFLPPAQQIDAFRQHLALAEASFSASAGSAANVAIARAEGFALLGAYWRGLQALSSVPLSEALPLRVQLLVAAGLEEPAWQLARSTLGDGPARDLVTSLRSEFSRRPP